MSLASNLAALGRLLTAAATGIVNGTTPASGDNSTALATTAWMKAEQAAETVQGTAKVATQAITNAGTDDTTIVTPKKLRAGFAISLNTNGYIAFPSWLGGLIVQWGYISLAGSVYTANVTLPVAWPAGWLGGVASDSGSSCYSMGAIGISSTQVQVWVTTAKGSAVSGVNWIAIGR